MSLTFLLDAAIAAILVAGWYLVWRDVNRRRAEQVVSWIQRAVCGRAYVSAPRWHRPSRFDVELRFASGFRESIVTVQLTPRELPIQWLLARLRKQQEQVTFQAELERRPSSNLIVANHRCFARTDPDAPPPDACFSLGSLVITTREDWRNETSVVERLLAARSQELHELEFRTNPPHLLLTVPLESLNAGKNEPGLFTLLQELATCASARRS